MTLKFATLLSRREFVRRTGMVAATVALPGAGSGRSLPATAIQDPGKLKRYVDALPVLPIAQPAGKRPDPSNPAEKLPFYRMAMSEFESRVHRDLEPAHMWGFNGVSPGPVIDVRTGRGVLVEWANELPRRHLFTIDHNLMGAERGNPDVRSVVHLHGAKAPPESDGYPESWFVAGKSAICHYPNRQDACLLWYHDHAMGINRLNIYAGLLGLYIVRDDAEDALGLPRGEHEVPLVLCDRKFTVDGQLAYDVSPDPAAPWMPEFYGNATLINGKLFPYLEVQPALYRFRVLNGSNAQFFNLSLSTGEPIAQIGTDQGLLPAPVPAKIVSLAPGERADLVVDFTGSAGQELTLKTGPVEDIMQFRVAPGSSRTGSLPERLRPVPPIPESSAVRTRLLTLNEYKSPKGESMTMLLGGAHWDAPVTETPALDTAEIWSLINLTEDVHPIHLHLVRFQILDRRSFDQLHYFMKGELKYIGPPMPPDPGEAGWKDTVRAHPQMVTRIIARFEGYAGRYVWHCHILEHEDNEMMRPFQVLPRT
ncbi:MAG TPA: multicopper oxidase [Terracidiphilus sp.]|nr:multicopper oxidase [Terracidiphilus sp.]